MSPTHSETDYVGNLIGWRRRQNDLLAHANALRAFLVETQQAQAANVRVSEGTHGSSVSFTYPGWLTGSVEFRGHNEYFLSYIVANMWEYRETARFDSLDELQRFVDRLIKVILRLSPATRALRAN